MLGFYYTTIIEYNSVGILKPIGLNYMKDRKKDRKKLICFFFGLEIIEFSQTGESLNGKKYFILTVLGIRNAEPEPQGQVP